jgi:5-methylcytosine-specific restriction enzyme A
VIHYIAHLLTLLAGSVARLAQPSVRRSPRWPHVRAVHLQANPTCTVCGRKDMLEAHHVVPVHMDRAKELEPGNLITLCDPGQGGCHLMFGHLGNWSSWNSKVRVDAALWNEKVRERPRG